MGGNEWESCSDPQRMLRSLSGKASERQARLLAVACCRRLWPLLTDPRAREAVEMAERYADERAGMGKWAAAFEAYRAARRPFASTAAFFAHAAVAHLLADVGTDPVAYAAGASSWAAGAGRSHAEEQGAQAGLVRCIFGPWPLRPWTVDEAVLQWNDQLVLRLGRAIYDERRWGDMPILADALLDAGCVDEALLAHCRSGGEHIAGCWAVDLVLGRS
jgi:hypothetical protein